MFEELEAKRVCRSDLRSSSPLTDEPDEEAQDLLRSRLEKLYGPISTNEPTHIDIETVPSNELQESNAEEQFEFRLFATSRSANDGKVNRVILKNDDHNADREVGFVVPWRDVRYFFTGEITPRERRRFELAAVSGEDVQQGLHIRHAGLERPWRVSVVKKVVSHPKISKAKDVEMKDIEMKDEENNPVLTKRKRMGKKMRILHRKREKIRKEILLSEQEKLALKETAEREKKTKRNKEKQLKKRAKEKAKKASQIDIVMNE